MTSNYESELACTRYLQIKFSNSQPSVAMIVSSVSYIIVCLQMKMNIVLNEVIAKHLQCILLWIAICENLICDTQTWVDKVKLNQPTRTNHCPACMLHQREWSWMTGFVFTGGKDHKWEGIDGRVKNTWRCDCIFLVLWKQFLSHPSIPKTINIIITGIFIE